MSSFKIIPARDEQYVADVIDPGFSASYVDDFFTGKVVVIRAAVGSAPVRDISRM